MSIRRAGLLWALIVVSLLSLSRRAFPGISSPACPHQVCQKAQPARFNPKAFARQSVLFRKNAEKAWRATHNGDAPFEAGFSIDKDGRPGKVQLSLFATVDAATHLDIASSPSALGTLHVHNRFGKPTPSPEDIHSAEMWGQTIYVESRTGLYAVNPDGRVCHLFNDEDWFSKRELTASASSPWPTALRGR